MYKSLRTCINIHDINIPLLVFFHDQNYQSIMAAIVPRQHLHSFYNFPSLIIQ